MRIPRPILATLAALLLTGAGCGLSGTKPVTLDPVTLQYWRTEDQPDALDEAIAAYVKLHPNVTINVTRPREEDYERTLLEALAADKGPDLFSIPNVWLGGWKGKILPLPKELAIATPTVQGQKIVVVKEKKPTLSLVELRNTYVEGIAKDLLVPVVEKVGMPPVDRIQALPFSADTLAMYYNKDLFRKGNIEKPPATWADLQDVAKRLTLADQEGKIRQAGAAIGSGKNVRHSAALLSALMRQNGATLFDASGRARFQYFPDDGIAREESPGVQSLIFYQSFTVPGSQSYSWNASMPDSFDAFVAGSVAIYFGLPSDATKIRNSASRLDFGIAPLPQISLSTPKNILEYPLEVVSKKSKNPDVAWDFLEFAASKEQVGTYLAKTKRPTVLRALLSAQVNDPDIGPFAAQTLTAERWYAGDDVTAAEAAFAFMIETPPTDEFPSQHIVSQAADRVNATFR